MEADSEIELQHFVLTMALTFVLSLYLYLYEVFPGMSAKKPWIFWFHVVLVIDHDKES